MVTELEIYREIRRLMLEGETSQRQVAQRLGISRNTVKSTEKEKAFLGRKKHITVSQ